METTQVANSRWVDQENVVNTYNGILFSNHNRSIHVIYNNMDEAGNDYAKWNSRKEIPDVVTYMWNIKKPDKVKPQNQPQKDDHKSVTYSWERKRREKW